MKTWKETVGAAPFKVLSNRKTKTPAILIILDCISVALMVVALLITALG